MRARIDADGADEQPHAVLLAGEDVFHRRAHGGTLRIGMGDMRGTRSARRLLVIDRARKHGALEEGLVLLRAIGRLRPWP
jgi:hypothetical protein